MFFHNKQPVAEISLKAAQKVGLHFVKYADRRKALIRASAAARQRDYGAGGAASIASAWMSLFMRSARAS